MCKYCENPRGFFAIKGKLAYIMGTHFNHNFIVEYCGRYRILTKDILTAPIQYCPKCGKKLDAED